MSFETGGAVRMRGRRFHENANEIYRLPSFDYLSEDALKKFIEKHETEQVPRLKKLKDYFLNHTDIKYRNDRADEERADYRMSHNFARYISILIQGYILGKPITYNHENGNLLTALNEFNDRNKEQSHNSNLELNLSIYGRAFELVYMNQQSEECVATVDPIQAFLIYDTTVEGNVIAGVRYFNVQVGEDVERFIEVYNDQKVKMEEEYLTNQSTKNKTHWEIYHVLHTFSLRKSKEEINEYNQKVIQALRKPFEVPNGFYVSKSQLDYMQTLREEDAFHGVLRFTFTISKG
ncbi:phage portal protein [Priestia endophytica]|uniref:phage portal protein n=1 Tax=Priestia endophytica TaxID=135735 RepID=UPI000DCA43B5|nr:phage portal protein [Priestia endophytica]RAS74431.1 hypothetical protein A4R27_24105 [Priestia endophytica]